MAWHSDTDGTALLFGRCVCDSDLENHNGREAESEEARVSAPQQQHTLHKRRVKRASEGGGRSVELASGLHLHRSWSSSLDHSEGPLVLVVASQITGTSRNGLASPLPAVQAASHPLGRCARPVQRRCSRDHLRAEVGCTRHMQLRDDRCPLSPRVSECVRARSAVVPRGGAEEGEVGGGSGAGGCISAVPLADAPQIPAHRAMHDEFLSAYTQRPLRHATHSLGSSSVVGVGVGGGGSGGGGVQLDDQFDESLNSSSSGGSTDAFASDSRQNHAANATGTHHRRSSSLMSHLSLGGRSALDSRRGSTLSSSLASTLALRKEGEDDFHAAYSSAAMRKEGEDDFRVGYSSAGSQRASGSSLGGLGLGFTPADSLAASPEASKRSSLAWPSPSAPGQSAGDWTMQQHSNVESNGDNLNLSRHSSVASSASSYNIAHPAVQPGLGTQSRAQSYSAGTQPNRSSLRASTGASSSLALALPRSDPRASAASPGLRPLAQSLDVLIAEENSSHALAERHQPGSDAANSARSSSSNGSSNPRRSSNRAALTGTTTADPFLDGYAQPSPAAPSAAAAAATLVSPFSASSSSSSSTSVSSGVVPLRRSHRGEGEGHLRQGSITHLRRDNSNVTKYSNGSSTPSASSAASAASAPNNSSHVSASSYASQSSAASSHAPPVTASSTFLARSSSKLTTGSTLSSMQVYVDPAKPSQSSMMGSMMSAWGGGGDGANDVAQTTPKQTKARVGATPAAHAQAQAQAARRATGLPSSSSATSKSSSAVAPLLSHHSSLSLPRSSHSSSTSHSASHISNPSLPPSGAHSPNVVTHESLLSHNTNHTQSGLQLEFDRAREHKAKLKDGLLTIQTSFSDLNSTGSSAASSASNHSAAPSNKARSRAKKDRSIFVTEIYRTPPSVSAGTGSGGGGDEVCDSVQEHKQQGASNCGTVFAQLSAASSSAAASTLAASLKSTSLRSYDDADHPTGPSSPLSAENSGPSSASSTATAFGHHPPHAVFVDSAPSPSESPPGPFGASGAAARSGADIKAAVAASAHGSSIQVKMDPLARKPTLAVDVSTTGADGDDVLSPRTVMASLLLRRIASGNMVPPSHGSAFISTASLGAHAPSLNSPSNGGAIASAIPDAGAGRDPHDSVVHSPSNHLFQSYQAHQRLHHASLTQALKALEASAAASNSTDGSAEARDDAGAALPVLTHAATLPAPQRPVRHPIFNYTLAPAPDSLEDPQQAQPSAEQDACKPRSQRSQSGASSPASSSRCSGRSTPDASSSAAPSFMFDHPSTLALARRYLSCLRSRDIEGLMGLYAEDPEPVFAAQAGGGCPCSEGVFDSAVGAGPGPSSMQKPVEMFSPSIARRWFIRDGQLSGRMALRKHWAKEFEAESAARVAAGSNRSAATASSSSASVEFKIVAVLRGVHDREWNVIYERPPTSALSPVQGGWKTQPVPVSVAAAAVPVPAVDPPPPSPSLPTAAPTMLVSEQWELSHSGRIRCTRVFEGSAEPADFTRLTTEPLHATCEKRLEASVHQ